MGMNRRGFLGRLLGGAAALVSPRALANVPQETPAQQIARRSAAMRDDIQDMIYKVSPVDNPVAAAARKPRASKALHEWTTDVLTLCNEERSKQG